MALIIDAHNYIKRAYHSGVNPYTLAFDLFNKPGEKFLVCDGPKSRNYRRSIYDKYKQGRNTGDDPVYWEVYSNIKELFLLYDDHILIEMEEGEADDWIVAHAKADSIVISNDKDLWPLIDKGVTILLNASTKVTVETVQTKFNCVPKHIYLYKALVGDPSDKIPGKRGFGPSAWAKMNFEDRELYNYHFKIGNCEYDPKLMTEQACISWKLAIPYEGLTYVLDEGWDQDRMKWIEEKGVIL